MLIKSNAVPDSIVKLSLTGTKDSVGIASNLYTIDLGKIFENVSKDTSFSITNTGTISTKIIITAPNDLNISATNFNLNPAQIQNINIHFPGLPTAGQFNEQIIFTDTICNRTLIVKIQDTILAPASALIQAGSAEGYPGDIIEIPIYLRNSQNVMESGAKRLYD